MEEQRMRRKVVPLEVPVEAVQEAVKKTTEYAPIDPLAEASAETIAAFHGMELAGIEKRIEYLQGKVDEKEAREAKARAVAEAPQALYTEAVRQDTPQLIEAEPTPTLPQPMSPAARQEVLAAPLADVAPVNASMASLEAAVADVPPSRVPRMIGEYVVIKKRAEGGLLTVYEAYHRGLSEDHAVALKVPKEGTSAKGETAIDLHRRVLMKLGDHYNIPRIVAAEPGVYVAEQLLEGKTLQELITKAREQEQYLKEASVCGGGIQMLRALAYMHTKGVIHRDVKPANIVVNDGPLLDKEEQPNHWFITDFNVSDEKAATVGSMYTGSSTSLTGFTDLYASPEQRRGEKVDGRSDLYSLAVTLFEALTGELPLGSSTDPHEINPKLSRDYSRFFQKAFQRDPAKRFQTAQEMYEALVETSRGKYGGGTIFSISNLETRISVDVWHEKTEKFVHSIAYVADDNTEIMDYSISPDGTNMAVLVMRKISEITDKGDLMYSVRMVHLPSKVIREAMSPRSYKKLMSNSDGDISGIQFVENGAIELCAGGKWMMLETDKVGIDGLTKQRKPLEDECKNEYSPNGAYKVERVGRRTDGKLIITGVDRNSTEAFELESGKNPHWSSSDVGLRYVKIPEPAPVEAPVQEASPLETIAQPTPEVQSPTAEHMKKKLEPFYRRWFG